MAIIPDVRRVYPHSVIIIIDYGLYYTMLHSFIGHNTRYVTKDPVDWGGTIVHLDTDSGYMYIFPAR